MSEPSIPQTQFKTAPKHMVETTVLDTDGSVLTITYDVAGKNKALEHAKSINSWGINTAIEGSQVFFPGHRVLKIRVFKAEGEPDQAPGPEGPARDD